MQKRTLMTTGISQRGPISSFKHAKTNYSTSVFFDLIKSSDIAKIYTRKNNFTSTRNQSRDTSVRSVTAKRFDEKERDQIDLTIWSMQGRTQREPKSQAPKAGNWTKLNSTERFSSVQFSFPLWIEPATICNDSVTKSAVVAGSSQSRLICESANQRNVCRWTKIGDELLRLATAVAGLSTAVAGSWLSRTCDGRRRSSPVQFTAENWTELNWKIQFSSVQFSSPGANTEENMGSGPSLFTGVFFSHI